MYGICGFSTASEVSTKQSIGNTIFRRQLNRRAYGSDPDVFFLREENCKLTAQQKQTLAQVNALFSGILLTSDMPSRYTDEMRRQYNALRGIDRTRRKLHRGCRQRSDRTLHPARQAAGNQSLLTVQLSAKCHKIFAVTADRIAIAGRGWYNV